MGRRAVPDRAVGRQRGVAQLVRPEAAQQVADVRDAPSSRRAGVLQTLACPWCGTKLLAQRDLRPDDDRRRILLYCPAGEGPDPCPFSEMQAPGEGLPILTVDEEIYRHLPSLVIATVDKLAQLPWRGYAGMLFGRVSSRCPRHGYRHDDLDERTGCRRRHNETRLAKLPAVTSQPVTRLRPPNLIVQDDLHLISGSLAPPWGCSRPPSTNCAAGRLGRGADRSQDRRIHRDDQAGAGAGARNFRPGPGRLSAAGPGHRRHLLLPPGPGDAARRHGRRYLGICAHGVRLKSAEIRLAESCSSRGSRCSTRTARPPTRT